jgi:hypothetical protein
LNTVFVGKAVQGLKHGLGATYFDCFMIFQAFGTWGIVILMRTFREIHEKTQTEETNLPLYLLFLPSIHFWTSAIGKDAPVFFAVALCTWSVLKISRRRISFLISITLMALCRPHIALAAGLSIALASLIHGQFSLGRKILLLGFSVLCAGVLLSAVRSSFGVDVTNPASLSQFFEGRGAAEAYDTATTRLGSSFLLRLFSLLFRPFFFDAKNAFGVIASIENIGSVVLFLYLVMHIASVFHLSKKVLFVRFCFIMLVVLSYILSVLNYNVGLGLRERVMMIPPLLCLFVATSAFVQLRRRSLVLSQGLSSSIAIATVSGPADHLPTS